MISNIAMSNSNFKFGNEYDWKNQINIPQNFFEKIYFDNFNRNEIFGKKFNFLSGNVQTHNNINFSEIFFGKSFEEISGNTFDYKLFGRKYNFPVVVTENKIPHSEIFLKTSIEETISDEELLSISEKIISQRKKVYEALAK